MRACRLPGFVIAILLAGNAGAQSTVVDTNRYEFRAEHDPNGIGKFYLGREIARVMGHEGAAWLERPEREEEERTSLLLQELRFRPGEIVADIGAGTGYFARRIAKEVVPGGRVYAVDIQTEMIALLEKHLAHEAITNVTTVLGGERDPRLPTNAVDTILMVDVYHEFEHPFEMVSAMCRALKKDGRMVFVEYRAEDPAVPIKRVHKMSEAQVRKEMAPHPLSWRKTISVLPRQHIIVFERL